MYAKIKNKVVEQYPYGFTELQSDNPLTSFGSSDVFSAFQSTTGAVLVNVVAVSQPVYNIETQFLVEKTPVLTSTGEYEQSWQIVELFDTPQLKATAIAANLARLKTAFIAQVKAEAGALTQQVLQGLESEYELAEKEATSYKVAGYPVTPIPNSVQDEIASKAARGIILTATVACNTILAAAAGWRNAQAELRRKRLTVASEAYVAIDSVGLDMVKAQWAEFMVNLHAMLGIPQTSSNLPSMANGIIPVTVI